MARREKVNFEALDHAIAEALADDAAPAKPANGPARILVVEAQTDLRTDLVAALVQRGHQVTGVPDPDAARAAISRSRLDVIVLSNAGEESCSELAPLVQRTSPSTKLVVVSPAPNIQTAIHAIRCGAVDYLCWPMECEEMARRIDAAILKSRVERQRDERVAQLKKVCKELNVARHEITKQIDSLCNDLVNAYQGMAEQMNEVAMASEFRTLLKQELDVEDLLRTTLEYLLTKTGPTNAAVFLPDATDHYGLGAYVNYDCPRETVAVMLDHLCQAICPQMANENEIVSFDDASEFAQWVGSDAGFLSDSQVIAFSCRSKKDCLAVFVLFRNKSNPFDEKLGAVMDLMREIIAEQLATVIRIHHRAHPSWPKEAADGDLDINDEYGFGRGGLAA